MRRIHLATILGLCCLLLLAVGGGVALHAAGDTPPCDCTDNPIGWTTLGNCGGQTCAAQNLVTDSLSCTWTAPPGPCPLTGSVTVAYDNCTQVVCVAEYHTAVGGATCNTFACLSVPYSTVEDGGEVTPTQDPCCDPGCNYKFEVTFWSTGPCGTGTLHCQYEHDFICEQ